MTDMTGKTCVVTGASAGIGAALAEGLAARGASLAIVARDEQRLAEVAAACRAAGAPEVRTYACDFASLEEVRELALRLLEDLPRIDVLCNNAGATFTRRAETVDGYERTFAVNHLAPYLLTRLLTDRLVASAPARVVTTASDSHEFGPLDPADYMTSARRYQPLKVYGRSKLANILFTTELAHRLEGTGVTANAFHPGFVATSIGRDHPLGVLVMKVARPFIKSPKQGADTGVWLATEDVPDNGRYFVKRRVHAVKNDAQDPKLAQQVWEDSARLVGLD